MGLITGGGVSVAPVVETLRAIDRQGARRERWALVVAVVSLAVALASLALALTAFLS
jgi:hypothetical protein